jgi:hypothetical protein
MKHHTPRDLLVRFVVTAALASLGLYLIAVLVT